MEQIELVHDPTAADSKVLEHLCDPACQPPQPRGIRHFIYLPTSAAAAAVAQVLEREGWDTDVQEAEDTWLVVAGCLRVLSEPLVRQIRARLAALAAAHDGSYDGWDAQREPEGQVLGVA